MIMIQESVVPGTGIEPVRLAARDFKSLVSTNFTIRAKDGGLYATAEKQRGKAHRYAFPLYAGAAEESRTLDLNLGKVALYQLSYCRDDLLEARPGIEPRYTALQAAA